MKRIGFGMIAALLLFSSSAVQARERGTDAAEYAVSLKAWVNEWKHIDPALGRTIADDVVVLAGPAIEIKYGNLMVVESAYLVSLSDYTLKDPVATSDLKRRDFELGIGKQLNRHVAFFLGYRNSLFKEKATGIEEFSYGNYYSLRGTVDLSALSSLYGNLTYLDTRFKAEGVAREEAPGWITEIGGRTAFTERLAMKLGYKWETTEGKTSRMKDSFRGTTLELVYGF